MNYIGDAGDTLRVLCLRCGGDLAQVRHTYPAERAAAMGVEWMTGKELSQAIPPAFTLYIGGYLRAEVERQRSAS